MIKVVRTSTVSVSIYILLKGQLKFLAQYFSIVAISSKDGFLDKTSEREGIKTLGVDMERGVNVWKDLISLFRLYVQLKKEKPTIIHSITPKAGLLSMLAGKMAGVPIRMHTFTGLIFPSREGMMQKLLIKMDQLLCWAATNIYPEGNGVKSDLKKFNITSKELKIIANGNVNGIDLQYFDPSLVTDSEINVLKEKLKISNDDFVFIFVGRLVRDKGINELISAFSKLSRANVKLLLLGVFEQHLDPLHEATLTEIKNNENIISVGFQNDVRAYYSLSDALVFPSYREGFPNVVMQAGAMNLPSIVSDISGCNEIIVHDVNGVIIPPKEINPLLQAMKEFAENKTYVGKLKKNSRKMIHNRYEQSIVWNALLEEYRILLKNKGYDL